MEVHIKNYMIIKVCQEGKNMTFDDIKNSKYWDMYNNLLYFLNHKYLTYKYGGKPEMIYPYHKYIGENVIIKDDTYIELLHIIKKSELRWFKCLDLD